MGNGLRTSMLATLLLGCGAREAPEPPEPAGEPDPADTLPPAVREVPAPAPTAPPPVPRAPASKAYLPLRAHNGVVRIYSELELPFGHYAHVAESTRERANEWLGVESSYYEPVDLFLLAGSRDLARLERILGLPAAGGWRQRANGGYYHLDRTIAMVVEPERDTAWLVSHEMWHSVFRDVARRHPVALNEGLAEVLPSWILYGSTGRPEENFATYPDYEPVLARLVAAGEVPPLEELIGWSSDRFHADRWASFSLAWCMAKMLMESPHPRVRDCLPRLMQHLGTNETAWEDLCDVYDRELLEKLWARWPARLARRTGRR